jgi:hypothetical protein
MSQRTDAEFEAIIHDDPAPAPVLESDDAIHLREDLEPAHASEKGELPAHSVG